MSRRNFRKIWINVKIMEHATRQLRWTKMTFCKRTSLEKEFPCGTIPFEKGLRSFVKRQLHSSYCRKALSTSMLAAQNLSVTFENVYSNRKGPGLARVG